MQSISNLSTKRIPRYFLDFDGINSCVRLHDLDRWPSYGYTISLWLSVDSFADANNSVNYQPRLLSCLNNHGDGLEVYFVHSILHVKTGSQNTNPVTANFRFETKQWYHLVITHTYSKLEWLPVLSAVGKSSIKFYVNGALVSENSIKSPDLDVSIEGNEEREVGLFPYNFLYNSS
jgi:hypothetical protein